MEDLRTILIRNGIGTSYHIKKWAKNNLILLNGKTLPLTTIVNPNDNIIVKETKYAVTNSNDTKRLRLLVPKYLSENLIKGKIRTHCSYHKCLTMYVRRCFDKAVRIAYPLSGSYRHFFHRIDDFYRNCNEYNISTISGSNINLDLFEDIKVSRFIRDPRDLLISGYFYHKRSAEDWCNHINPEDLDWGIVNGAIPKAIPKDTSFSQYLNKVSIEEGLLAEIEFRKYHFKNMLNFNDSDSRVQTYRYEEIIGNEEHIFNKIFSFFEIPPIAKKISSHYVKKYSATSILNKSDHIRNPNSGQWKKYFTPKVEDRFNEKYTDLLIKLGY